MDKVTKTNTKGRQRQRLLKRIILHVEWRSWMIIFSVNSYFSMHEEKETLLATGFVQHSIFKSTPFRNISFKLLHTWLQGVAGTWNHSGPSTRNANPVNNKSSHTADRTNNFAIAVSDTQPVYENFQQLFSYTTKFHPHSHSWNELFQQRDYIV